MKNIQANFMIMEAQYNKLERVARKNNFENAAELVMGIFGVALCDETDSDFKTGRVIITGGTGLVCRKDED